MYWMYYSQRKIDHLSPDLRRISNSESRHQELKIQLSGVQTGSTLNLFHRKPSIQRCTAALSASVTYIIAILSSPSSAGLSVPGCFLRSNAMLRQLRW